MKKIFIYSFLLVLISCTQTHEKTIQGSHSHSSVSSYDTDSASIKTFKSTQNTGDGTCNFKGYCSLKTKPETEILMRLHFHNSGAMIYDTLDTQLFSKFMDLNNVENIQIDSLDFKMIDREIKLKFIISLFRDEEYNLKTINKYSMVYSSGFKNSKPKMVVDKIERSLIEILGNTY